MANLWRYDTVKDKWVQVSEEDPLPMINADLVWDDNFNQTDLVEGVIEAPEATLWKGMDIYNDSEANALTFTLKNGTSTVASFTLNTGEAIAQERFNLFDSIEITGTTPTFRIIVRK
jgi:hypothetical protein